MEEERRIGEELRCVLETEREELRTKLKDATDEVRSQITLPECLLLPDIKGLMMSAVRLLICALRSAGWSQ